VDRRHVELARDEFLDRKRKPALRVRFRSDLPLGEVEERDDRRHLPALRIAGDDFLRGFRVGRRPLKTFPARPDLRIVDDAALPSH
jgi:hypothetical protein